MPCPKCESPTQIEETRTVDKPGNQTTVLLPFVVYRWRKCLKCNFRFGTEEHILDKVWEGLDKVTING